MGCLDARPAQVRRWNQQGAAAGLLIRLNTAVVRLAVVCLFRKRPILHHARLVLMRYQYDLEVYAMPPSLVHDEVAEPSVDSSSFCIVPRCLVF